MTIQVPPPRKRGEQLEAKMSIENTTSPHRVKPSIVLSADDYERLSVLAHAARKQMPDLADELADEVGRARVLAKGEHPQHVVCMNSEVEFRDDTTGKIQRVTLVYPEHADILQRKVSVLTPVGTALIGLEEDSSITWETPNGEVRQLTVLLIPQPQPD
ncbi:nucleoside diphosphate kinase regulator [Rhodoplanes sp. Z2-YC6860]|uniref:nucleoside diphosphate kinase regulator n=1 Tax=Rhodoplanes sp. Z2-YC6860 TaxID=674703 RepID=UPI00078E8CDD|nr:nucleoside diphosphate kinase regulator [Rhodoplanes sp. Z2-YC6860]AMN44116.1 GreA/GreB family elongation factor [Rhodoplanes sp. Z2-YC6860]